MFWRAADGDDWGGSSPAAGIRSGWWLLWSGLMLYGWRMAKTAGSNLRHHLRQRGLYLLFGARMQHLRDCTQRELNQAVHARWLCWKGYTVGAVRGHFSYSISAITAEQGARKRRRSHCFNWGLYERNIRKFAVFSLVWKENLITSSQSPWYIIHNAA